MNKNVIITGGNKGIGLETTKLFFNKGYQVYILARDFSNFELKNEDNIHCIECDLSNLDNINGIFDSIESVDILINNAGIFIGKTYDKYSEEEIKKVMDVNLHAPIKLIEEASKKMIKNKFGRIINLSSISGQAASKDLWYGISKAGIIATTKSFARNLGSHGITVNAVAPGPVETDMVSAVSEESKNKTLESTYLKRFALPEEIAKTIFCIATEFPEYINGQTIDINNGLNYR